MPRSTKRTIDLTEYNIDIDSLIDVYKEVQTEAGIDTGLVESDLELDSKGNIVRTKHHNDGHECDKKCDQCHKHDDAENTGTSNVYQSDFVSKLGQFRDYMSPELEDPNDDGLYVCEYCTSLGYRKEYTPYMCDTCTSCEGCSEFESGDCSGCSFSSYRTGRLYSEELRNNGQDVPIDDEHEELVTKFDTSEYTNDRRVPSKAFSIMDYNHRY